MVSLKGHQIYWGGNIYPLFTLYYNCDNSDFIDMIFTDPLLNIPFNRWSMRSMIYDKLGAK